jgi:glycosyltransferase involved in cell wall biosynthesis
MGLSHKVLHFYYRINTNTLVKGATTLQPKFSVIIANYNHASFIQQSIESVLSQTFKDWELIIIDDGSTDNSLSVIEKYLSDKRIKIVRHKKNKGYAAALRTGIAEVKAEFFGILDSDDVLTPNALETMYSTHIKYLDAGPIYSQFMYCDENLKPTQIGYCKQIPGNKTNLDSDAVSHFKTFKLKFYNQTEGYTEEILHAQDKDISYKMEEVS